MPGWRAQGRLVLLNSLTCGLEICVAAGITYVPPLLLEAGVEERYMTMVLGIGPVLGLLFIPLIGSASDRCVSSYGRRRPFIWLLSLGVLLSLLIIPHADVLATRLGRGGRPLQVGLLILGVGLLDFCGQVCFTPLEALLSDLYGIRMGSLGLFLQCATSTVFSLAMSRLVRRFGTRRVYLGSMASFTASALVICLSKSVALVTAMSALTGFAYATLQTLPYTLTCHYHKEEEIYLPKKQPKYSKRNGSLASHEVGCLTAEGANGELSHVLCNANRAMFFVGDTAGHSGPLNGPAVAPAPPPAEDHGKRGVGLDFAMLDSTFLLSQVFPTLFMGMIVQLTESVTTYMASSAIFGSVAIYLVGHVVFEQKDLRN